MLNVSEKYFTRQICEKYVGNIEKIVFSKSSAKSKYKKILSIKEEYENDKICNEKLSDKGKELISYVINFNLFWCKKLANKPSPFQMFIKGMGKVPYIR